MIKSRPHNAPAEGVEGIAISPEEKEISAEMRENFSEYLNSLNLRDSLGNKLTLTPDGNGLFREYIESLYLESAQDAIDSGESLKNPVADDLSRTGCPYGFLKIYQSSQAS